MMMGDTKYQKHWMCFRYFLVLKI